MTIIKSILRFSLECVAFSCLVFVFFVIAAGFGVAQFCGWKE